MATFKVRYAIIPMALAVFATHCTFNIFAPMDSPSGDPQNLSAARAALDNGDYVNALKYYQKLSSNDSDVSSSEQALSLLVEENAGMGPFVSAFGTSGTQKIGPGLTALANNIGTKAGATARNNILAAFQDAANISDPHLQGFVEFISAATMISEILAEGAQTAGSVQPSDLVVDPTDCVSAGGTACVTSVSCDIPTFSNALQAGNSTVAASLADLTSATLTPTLSVIQTAISDVIAGLTLLSPSGGLSSSFSGFAQGATAVQAALATSNGACYREFLLSEGIGT